MRALFALINIFLLIFMTVATVVITVTTPTEQTYQNKTDIEAEVTTPTEQTYQNKTEAVSENDSVSQSSELIHIILLLLGSVFICFFMLHDWDDDNFF